MPTYSKDLPFHAVIKERYPLTKSGSKKNTQHIVIDLTDSGMTYKVGDSIGLFPENESRIIQNTLKASGLDEGTLVTDHRRSEEIPLGDFLRSRANLQKVTSKFLRFVLQHSLDSAKKAKLETLLDPQQRKQMKSFMAERWIWDCLEDLGPIACEAQGFVDVLLPMTPRFYSIASSQQVVGEEVHLTVALVEYETNGHRRRGVATQFLCQTAALQQRDIPSYVQPTRDFILPADHATPIIMVGPGTGIAPFVAFMQERVACAASGDNWLFFGDWNRANDYYYEDFWRQLVQAKKLRLDTAFSRDQAHKVYVQHRMLENASDLWDWLQKGAVFYVCGDAERMAKDVHAALRQICQEQGRMSEEDAKKYLKELRREKRYLRDVY